MSFDTMRLIEPLTRAIDAAGYTEPTPIQANAIPPILEGRDILGLAQTGTGKTAAFAIPILQRLMQSPCQWSGSRPIGARALVLSPTRELAQQVHESFEKYGKHTGLRIVAIVGGVRQHSQVQAMKSGFDVLIATPGRLLDLMQQRLARLTFVETVVLDEADRMLDIGFLPDIRRILAHVPDDRQTLLFSATMPPAIRNLANEVLRDPVKVQVAPVSAAAESIEHFVHFVEPHDKPALLADLLRETPGERTIVFARTKRGVDVVARELSRAGIRAAAMHGDKEQSHRTRILAEFRAGRLPVLVATDIAARGLHIESVARVINYDLAGEPETYVHRVGRTGRAGASGIAVSFCSSRDRNTLRAIERLIRTPLKRADGDELVEAPAEQRVAASRSGARGRGRGRGRGRRGGARGARVAVG